MLEAPQYFDALSWSKKKPRSVKSEVFLIFKNQELMIY
jgi:hypothetical protein